jgi:hypothetical protein
MLACLWPRSIDGKPSPFTLAHCTCHAGRRAQHDAEFKTGQALNDDRMSEAKGEKQQQRPKGPIPIRHPIQRVVGMLVVVVVVGCSNYSL